MVGLESEGFEDRDGVHAGDVKRKCEPSEQFYGRSFSYSTNGMKMLLSLPLRHSFTYSDNVTIFLLAQSHSNSHAVQGRISAFFWLLSCVTPLLAVRSILVFSQLGRFRSSLNTFRAFSGSEKFAKFFRTPYLEVIPA